MREQSLEEKLKEQIVVLLAALEEADKEIERLVNLAEDTSGHPLRKLDDTSGNIIFLVINNEDDFRLGCIKPFLDIDPERLTSHNEVLEPLVPGGPAVEGESLFTIIKGLKDGLDSGYYSVPDTITALKEQNMKEFLPAVEALRDKIKPIATKQDTTSIYYMCNQILETILAIEGKCASR